MWRVRSRSTFEQFRRQGRRVRRGPISVTFLVDGSDEPPKVAYAIGRKVGGAVQRNRLRRRLRAAVADLAPDMRPGAYLVSATAEAAGLTSGDLRAWLNRALRAAAQHPDSSPAVP